MLKEFKLPDLGEGLTESEIVSWRVSAGDRVTLNQIIADVETAKAVVELPSPFDGVVQQLHAEPGDTVDVGATIVTFELEEHAADADAPEPNLVGYGAGPESSGRPARRRRVDASAAAPVPADATAGEPVARSERPRSTPPVRYLAEQLGVDLTRLTGSGPDGLITREDVQAAAGAPADVARRGDSETSTPAAARVEGTLVRRVPIKGVRKHTAAAMVRSAFTAPHATVFLTVDVTPTVELLARLSERRDLAGTRVTLLALVARAFVIALRRHPELNSRWDDDAQEIVTYGNVNLGIAAATERGLVVPHIRDAHAMSLLQLAEALGELTRDARAGTTPPERLTGSTITISNPGVFGVDAGTPILNPGEAAILALGAVQNRPWEFQGELALRRVMTLSLSFDHRGIDGAEASQFLAELGALLADPALAMLHDAGTAPLPL
ncbi:MAG TPA: dihydrolipoamide acetyltransferase family protein [Pseudolysinimonas sp.]|nr:dihydrolipoamide acetyltransferase family protein [Pseudolysinimonas sp.]